MPYDYAVHSDLLVYWTGKDIDLEYDRKWPEKDKSDTRGKPELEQAYHERLFSILKYGLWATKPQEEPDDSQIGHVCFTELRLSLCRRHARQYGRLGIGVKRSFLFERGGRPVTYYAQEARFSPHDQFLQSCRAHMATEGLRHLRHFLKPMNSSDSLNYDWYAESEWRIVVAQKATEFVSYEEADKVAKQYVNSTDPHRSKFRYWVPLDGWLSCIIYPSVTLKARAWEDAGIRNEINRIKTARNHANRVERGNMPVEMDLDLCRNF